MACVNRLNVKFGELKQKREVREFDVTNSSQIVIKEKLCWIGFRVYIRSYFTKYLELLETKRANRVKDSSAFR